MAGPDAADDAPLRLGWEEWVALPGLNLPALKAKVDTGARTSALHADGIEPYGPAPAPRVRFTVHPIPGDALAIRCSAPLIDRREVTSSNGETELRYVIGTDLAIGGRRWPIELTLTDRGAMAYRMLLGRQAIPADAVVAPNEAFCQPVLSDAAYEGRRRARRGSDPRPLRIVLLTGGAEGPTLRRLTAEAEARDHEVIDVDAARCAMAMDGLAPAVWLRGERLPQPDAVIARIGVAHPAHGLAVLRQFAAMGAYCLNGAAAIAAAQDPVAAHQALARARVALPPSGFASAGAALDTLDRLLRGDGALSLWLPGAPGPVATPDIATARGIVAAMRGRQATVLVQRMPQAAPRLRCLVLGGRVVAHRRLPGGRARDPERDRAPDTAQRTLARRAAKALDLTLATVDLLAGPDGPVVAGVDPSPALDAMARATGADPYAGLLDLVERRLRPATARR